MDKEKPVAEIKQALDEILDLRRLNYKNSQLTAWLNKVSRTMEAAYGKDSAEYRRFVNAPGKAFIIRTELGQEQEYHRQLDSYEEVLKSLIE
ncbi:MAG: hypothetical protein HY528_00625 [Chloroflexi bacterium]|nr:hypothetical protein [Chloroflexota bacterium]